MRMEVWLSFSVTMAQFANSHPVQIAMSICFKFNFLRCLTLCSQCQQRIKALEEGQHKALNPSSFSQGSAASQRINHTTSAGSLGKQWPPTDMRKFAALTRMHFTCTHYYTIWLGVLCRSSLCLVADLVGQVQRIISFAVTITAAWTMPCMLRL